MTADIAFKTILVPVDLSELSGLALSYAAGLAVETGAKLEVLQVDEIIAPPDADPRWNDFVQDILEQERRDARKRLEAFVRRYAAVAPAANLSIERGMPADRILRAALKKRADLIVIGTHGRGGLMRWMLGSVTEAVLAGSKAPVLAVHGGELAPSDSTARVHCTRILCALDARSSPWSDVALRLSGRFARAFGASLIALKVLPQRDFERLDDEVGMAEERERFEDQLPEALRPLCPDFLARGGDAARVLLEEARALHAGLLVTSAGRRGRRHGLGKAAARVLRLSNCPVLVVPD